MIHISRFFGKCPSKENKMEQKMKVTNHSNFFMLAYRKLQCAKNADLKFACSQQWWLHLSPIFVIVKNYNFDMKYVSKVHHEFFQVQKECFWCFAICKIPRISPMEQVQNYLIHLLVTTFASILKMITRTKEDWKTQNLFLCTKNRYTVFSS